MADINIKDGGGGEGVGVGGGGGIAGGRYAYEMLKNAKNQKCTTSPGIGNVQSVANSEQTQWANDASDVALRSNGEWFIMFFFGFFKQTTKVTPK